MSSPPTENSISSAATPRTFKMQNRDKEVEVDGNDDDFDPHSVDLIVSYVVIEEEVMDPRYVLPFTQCLLDKRDQREAGRSTK